MSRKRSRRRVTERPATIDIVTQVECAIRRPEATVLGALVGAIVPWFARTLVHEDVPVALAGGNVTLAVLMIAVVIGCALFSAITVYNFGRATFGDARKAVGFVLAVEGVMLVSKGATSTLALVVLIAINALANGSSIALARDQTCRRREADIRRAATRARAHAIVATGSATVGVVEAKAPQWTPAARADLANRRASGCQGHA